MKRSARTGVFLAAMLMVGGSGMMRTMAQTIVNPSGQKIVIAGQPAPATLVADTRNLNEKQKALADEAERLLSMATELKEQVDMTNKNILSVKVVRKAEEIELFARRMKGEAKK